jgi:hypothetical protein
MPEDRRQNGPRSLGDLMADVARASGLNRSRPVHPALKAWKGAVGDDLSRVTRAVRFRSGELIVEVTTASHHHELVAFRGESLRRRVNELLGDETVRRIAFKHQSQ